MDCVLKYLIRHDAVRAQMFQNETGYGHFLMLSNFLSLFRVGWKFLKEVLWLTRMLATRGFCSSFSFGWLLFSVVPVWYTVCILQKSCQAPPSSGDAKIQIQMLSLVENDAGCICYSSSTIYVMFCYVSLLDSVTSWEAIITTWGVFKYNAYFSKNK